MFWEKFLRSGVLMTNLMLTELLLLFSKLSIVSGWYEDEFNSWFLSFFHQFLTLICVWQLFQTKFIILRIQFTELHKIMVNEVTFIGFRGGWSPQLPPSGSAPDWNINVWKQTGTGAMKKESSGATLMKTKRSRARAIFQKRRAPKLEQCHFYDSSAALKYPHWYPGIADPE